MALLLLAGCSNEPGTYDIPLAEAYQLLQSNPLDEFRRDRQCGLVYRLVPSGNGTDEVTWQVFSGGMQLLWFKARLTPASSDETKVTIEVETGGEEGKELYSGDYETPRPVVAQPVRPAIEEAIAAVLEKRPFNGEGLPSQDNPNLCNMQRSMLEDGRIVTVHDDLSKMPPRMADGGSQ